uniref:Uncharacterized protein n=1 Tax=Romanomermis culicivorax TaxID=13658 RepID=A0A915JZA3_ROMCU
MELLLNVEAGDGGAQGQVEKFFGVKDFMDLLRDLMLEMSFLKNKGHDDIKNLIRLDKDGLMKGAAKQLTANLDIPFEYGFTHGFLFSTYPIHKLDIKVHAYGGLTLQKQAFIESLRDFRSAVS